MTTLPPQIFTGNTCHQVTEDLLTTPTTSTTPTDLITLTSKNKICIPLTPTAILLGVLVTNPSPNHKYNTHNCPPITPLHNLPTPQQISQSQTTSPPQKIFGKEAIAQGQAISNAQKGPQGNPQAQANRNPNNAPPPQSPSPPKSANESPNPKKPPLPKKSLMPKKEPKETPMTEETQRPHSAPQKENLTITSPWAEIKEERVEPRHGNCKRRILNTDDSDDEIGNINENEAETKKSRNVVFCDLLWPLAKMDQREYSRHFNVQMIEAMGMFHQVLVRLTT